MSETTTDHIAAKSPWPRRLLWAMAVLLPAGLVFQFFIHFRLAGREELRAAIAEADRLDPGWRLEELEARRAIVPEKQNSALQITRIVGLEGGPVALLPRIWPDEKLADALAIEKIDPPVLLSDKQFELLRAEFSKLTAAITESRKLAEMPDGRYPIQYSEDGMGTLLPHVQANRAVAKLLCMDALMLSREGRADEALRSCRAAINVSRSIGDEPFMISMLVRVACRAIAIRHIERILAQGQPSEDALVALQQLLEKDVQEPLLLNASRGERAVSHRALSVLASDSSLSSYAPGPDGKLITGIVFIDGAINFYRHGSFRSNHAAILRLNTRMIESLKLPADKQREEMGRIEGEMERLPPLAKLLAPAYVKVGNAHYRSLAEMRTAISAIAAERFRLANGRWPKSLNELTLQFQPDVPEDPFGNSPLLLKATAHGLVVYSVSKDGKDDGGFVDRKNSLGAGSDIAFRLWDVNRRRQSAAKEAKE